MKKKKQTNDYNLCVKINFKKFNAQKYYNTSKGYLKLLYYIC